MIGQEIRDILVKRGAFVLHHANSVSTSHSQLLLGGLASRHHVQQRRYPQTGQITDPTDQALGIWDDIFLDTVDIHQRSSNRNKYGPVLFKFHVDLLLALPQEARVLITRSNPSKWATTMTDDERYFMDATQLEAGLDVGRFDHMLVIRTPAGIIPFDRNFQAIILDEPRLATGTGQEYNRAEQFLNNAASQVNLALRVQRRMCLGCKCWAAYAENANRIPYFYSVP